MKVWITKYALTKGIIEMNATLIDDKYASGKMNYAGGSIFTTDFARTKVEALTMAKQKRETKIRSLEKQIKKLRAMVF